MKSCYLLTPYILGTFVILHCVPSTSPVVWRFISCAKLFVPSENAAKMGTVGGRNGYLPPVRGEHRARTLEMRGESPDAKETCLSRTRRPSPSQSIATHYSSGRGAGRTTATAPLSVVRGLVDSREGINHKGTKTQRGTEANRCLVSLIPSCLCAFVVNPPPDCSPPTLTETWRTKKAV